MDLRGTPRWLVPFAGRNRSGETTQNFLWGHDNVYIMDNHRAALWCWLQHVGPSQVVSVFHIDEHYDCLSSQIEKWLSALPVDVASMTIKEYLNHTYKTELGKVVPTVRWDNYLSLFLARYSQRISKLFFATHGAGQRPDRIFSPLPPDKLPRNVRSVMGDGREHQWIVNIDLDYFFCEQGGQRKPMFSDDYLKTVFGEIRECYEKGRVACLTICLTPDDGYTGGWKKAEALCAKVCDILGIEFSLPPP